MFFIFMCLHSCNTLLEDMGVLCSSNHPGDGGLKSFKKGQMDFFTFVKMFHLSSKRLLQFTKETSQVRLFGGSFYQAVARGTFTGWL